VLHGGKDVDKAKEIAATYCVYNAEECNEKAAAVARGNVVRDVVATALLAYLGGASGSEAKPCNSFVPGTEVLMADGTTKPIEDVKTGDKVLATDPKTGRTKVETVTADEVDLRPVLAPVDRIRTCQVPLFMARMFTESIAQRVQSRRGRRARRGPGGGVWPTPWPSTTP
jgi:lipoprotein-anchoring transpeptidase ErfK/SrfK